MTQEQKDLLLKDLCARLPYKTFVEYYDPEKGEMSICEIDYIDVSKSPNAEVGVAQYVLPIEKVKPYLFPLSSMIEEQRNEFDTQTFKIMFGECICKKNDAMGYGKLMNFDLNFYNMHHLDWRGLIPKGLALDATDKNIY